MRRVVNWCWDALLSDRFLDRMRWGLELRILMKRGIDWCWDAPFNNRPLGSMRSDRLVGSMVSNRVVASCELEVGIRGSQRTLQPSRDRIFLRQNPGSRPLLRWRIHLIVVGFRAANQY
jgi:hypothetical protein